MGVDMYEIVFELVAPLCAGEPSCEFIHVINGEIRSGDSKLAVGRIGALLVQVGRVADAGGDLFEIMEGKSPHLGGFHAALFKPHECDYKDAVRRQFVDILGLDLLMLEQVEIEPASRGKGLGLLAVSRTIDVFGENCGLIAMEPFPQQFRNYLDPAWRPPEGVEDPEVELRVATRKLRSYWARAGFKRVHGTEYYALCPGRKRPALTGIAAAVRGDL
jgi:hypothetical protein